MGTRRVFSCSVRVPGRKGTLVATQLFGAYLVYMRLRRFFVIREAGFSVHIVRRTALVALASVELAVLLAALTKPAYGYVDPGSGLLAVQVGGSMLAGGLFILRSKIRRLFGMTSNDGKVEAEKSAQPEPSK